MMALPCPYEVIFLSFFFLLLNSICGMINKLTIQPNKAAKQRSTIFLLRLIT